MRNSLDETAPAHQEARSRKARRSTEPDANRSVEDAEDNVAKLQSELDDAQQRLRAAKRAQEAHEAAARHAASVRTASAIAAGVVAVAVLLGFRRNKS